jgi:hypothetical protein
MTRWRDPAGLVEGDGIQRVRANDLKYSVVDLKSTLCRVRVLGVSAEHAHYSIAIEANDLPTAGSDNSSRSSQKGLDDLGSNPLI